MPAAQRPEPVKVTTQHLVDLVMNPRDPGYEAAAARRGIDPPRRWYDAPLVALGCAAIGFVLVLAYVHTHRGAPQAARVHDGLVARVRSAQRADDRLARTAQQLAAQFDALRAAALPSSGALAGLLNRSELAAGLVPVTGPGVEVVLSEPPAPSASTPAGRGGAIPIMTTHILTDRDVRSVVNELWADGAEAISVNGIRLTPTSAVRFAGQAVLVDFAPISSPYTIRAIGSKDSLVTAFAVSAVASRYQTLISVDGIGFHFGESEHLSLPASPGTTPRYAHLPGSPAPSPATSGGTR